MRIVRGRITRSGRYRIRRTMNLIDIHRLVYLPHLSLCLIDSHSAARTICLSKEPAEGL